MEFVLAAIFLYLFLSGGDGLMQGLIYGLFYIWDWLEDLFD